MKHQVSIAGSVITTARLRLRPWHADDSAAALEIYGSEDVSRWLAPALNRVNDVDQMRALITRWLAEPLGNEGRPTGRWAVDDIATGRLAGSGQILPLPPEGDDLALGYQFAPWTWGQGFGAEAGHALAHYAFTMGEEEVFAVVRPKNDRGVHTAYSIGMEWVGESEKYYNLRLQVFRLRKAELDTSELAPDPVER